MQKVLNRANEEFFWFLLGILFSMLFTAGCKSTYGTNFSSTSITDIEVGRTTQREIENYFGKPYNSELYSAKELEVNFWLYFFAEASKNLWAQNVLGPWVRRSLNIEFANGVVNAYLFNSGFKEDQTAFDGNRRSSLQTKKATKRECQSTLGSPSGIIRFPSHLLRRVSVETISKDPPAGAREAIVYYYGYEAERDGKRGSYFKWLVLFFDENNILLDKVYTESAP